MSSTVSTRTPIFSRVKTSSGLELLDQRALEVLRLAEPYPAVAGTIAVRVPFEVHEELPPDPLEKTLAPAERADAIAHPAP